MNLVTFLQVFYLALIVVMSLGTFAAYGWDKRQAMLHGRRIPERALHLLAFLGGWPGALVGQRTFRHKTQKMSFQVVFWLVVIAHIAIVIGVATFGKWARLSS